MDFFGVKVPPKIEYSLDQMDELAKHVVERNIAVPGIQPKLSLSLIKKTKKLKKIIKKKLVIQIQMMKTKILNILMKKERMI